MVTRTTPRLVSKPNEPRTKTERSGCGCVCGMYSSRSRSAARGYAEPVGCGAWKWGVAAAGTSGKPKRLRCSHFAGA